MEQCYCSLLNWLTLINSTPMNVLIKEQASLCKKKSFA